MEMMAKLLIFFGIILVIMGLVFLLLSKLLIKDIGKLPGDILIKRDNFLFYFPITTAIVLSLVLTVILNLIFFFTSKK